MASSQATGQDGGRSSRRLPFDAAERKKIIVLVVLAAVCAVVVLPQLIKSKGPATANAATVGSPAAATVDIESAVTEMRTSLAQPDKAAGGETVFGTVDEALDLFVGGARPQPVPVERLKLSVFGVPPAGDVRADAGKAGAAVNTTVAVAAVNDPLRADLGKLNLETVMISPRNRAAIINGQVLHLGEMAEGFRITGIEIGLVSLTRDGRRFTLTLK